MFFEQIPPKKEAAQKIKKRRQAALFCTV